MNPQVKKWLAQIGAKGGKMSRRELTREQAQEMARRSVAARKAKAQQYECVFIPSQDVRVCYQCGKTREEH